MVLYKQAPSAPYLMDAWQSSALACSHHCEFANADLLKSNEGRPFDLPADRTLTRPVIPGPGQWLPLHLGWRHVSVRFWMRTTLLSIDARRVKLRPRINLNAHLQ